MTANLRAHIFLFAAQVIYALNYVIAKDLMKKINPFGLVCMRILGAGLLFWLSSFIFKQEKIERKDFYRLLAMALFGIAINQTCFIYGLSKTEPVNSAIIMISNPIAVMIFTLIVFKERITGFKILGLLFGFAGAAILLSYKGNFALGSKTLFGDLLTLINSISWAVFIVIAKPMMQKYDTITVMKWIFLFGAVYTTPFLAPYLNDVDFASFTMNIWLALTFVVVATTFLAYLLNTFALKELSPSVVSAYIYVQPFLATLFAYAMGKDEITPVKIVSGVLIISGVYFISKKSRSKLS